MGALRVEVGHIASFAELLITTRVLASQFESDSISKLAIISALILYDLPLV